MFSHPIFIVSLTAFLYIFESSVTKVAGRYRTANEPGSASLTRVTHFAFLQNLGNPCGVSRAERISVSNSRPSSSPAELYQEMLTGILIAIQKLNDLQNTDPNLADCHGLYLKSLPPTPSFETLDVNDLFRQVYQSGIFLAAHLHIMSLDRQMLGRGSPANDDQVIEDPNQFSQVMTLRCGNESDAFLTLVRDLTTKIEDILCTLVEGSTREQRATFRIPYNALLGTQIYRYHSSCSLLLTRDCLLVKETKSVLNNMLSKFNRLLIAASDQLQFDSEYLEGENSLF